MCSGEALTADLAIRFFSVLPSGVMLLNFYGSTETTGDVTYEIMRSEADIKQFNGCVSLGKPADCSKVYVLDEEMKILPPGMTGEVAVSGLNVTDSYIGNKVSPHTGSNFVTNVFCTDKSHAVLYRMGDLGRIVDGRLYFEGRKDSQVKIRGKRVNLLEIENAIKKIPDVTSVVVLCATVSGDDNNVAPWDYTDKVPVAFIKIKGSDKCKAKQGILENML